MKRFNHIAIHGDMPVTIVARLPQDYNDFGEYALTEAGKDIYEDIINSLLPCWASRIGNDIYADIDTPDELIDELNVSEIVQEAYETICTNNDVWE